MTPLDIAGALDELIHYENGMKFQRLAVMLAQQKWPDLIASEWKSDLGLDAHAPAILARDRKGKGLACSITAKLSKIKEDIKRFRANGDDLKVLIFSTPHKVTRKAIAKWQAAINTEYKIDLVVVSREAIITDLMLPINASICRSILGISIPIDQSVIGLVEKIREANSEVINSWLIQRRLNDRPIIQLTAIILGKDGKETKDTMGLANIRETLSGGQRIVLEAPAGRGKTTTLVKLAELHQNLQDIPLLISLPEWTTAGTDILDYISKMPQFSSRAITAGDFAKVYETVPFIFLLNGWNEVSERDSEAAIRLLENLERNLPKAGIIVATRAHYIQPVLHGALRAQLRELNGKQRIDYLQQVLASRAEELCAQINSDTTLDRLTRIPLILSEITTIFLSGDTIPKTTMGVLEAAIRIHEQSDNHRAYLRDAPVSGHSRDYLLNIAVHMTTLGGVAISEPDARRIVQSVSKALIADGQISILPDPLPILNSLCAHHLLERIEYPTISFKFAHQQFREYYAALSLLEQLIALSGNDDHSGFRQFAQDYVNIPIWEESIGMIVEQLSELVATTPSAGSLVTAGKRLIELALEVDPVFAAQLSRLCGPTIWNEVRASVGARLRMWYQDKDQSHRQCALAGMIASGRDDFIDILLPLLTNADQQVRLSTYRAWHGFYPSCLGNDWRRMVNAWSDELREEFVGVVFSMRWMADYAEEFAVTDPGFKVKVAAIGQLEWIGATESLTRVLRKFNDQEFDTILNDHELMDGVPNEMNARALTAYERLLSKTSEPRGRLRLWLAAAKCGGDNVVDGLKEELRNWPTGKISDVATLHIKSALEIIHKADPIWVSHWVAPRIIDGSLTSDYWPAQITSVPDGMRDELFAKISTVDVGHPDTERIGSVLAKAADTNIARGIFSRLCQLKDEYLNLPDKTNDPNWRISRQLETLFRAVPTGIAVAGILSNITSEFNPILYTVVLDLFGMLTDEEDDFVDQMQDDSRKKLRDYIWGGIPFVLKQDDFRGEMKTKLALAISRVGDPEDANELYSIIRADVERMRRSRIARAQGGRSPLSEGALVSWSKQLIQALVDLDPQRAENILYELLTESEYEQDAAAGLVRLAKCQDEEKQISFGFPDYRTVWEARAKRQPSRFKEEQRKRFVTAIRQRIDALVKERDQGEDPNTINYRLKRFANILAGIDGRESEEIILEIIALPGGRNEWLVADTLESLLFCGAQLPADTVLGIINPLIEYIRTKSPADQHLIHRYLCILSFLNPPSKGIDRIKAVVTMLRIPHYSLRGVIVALGHSRSNDALTYLLEIATVSEAGMRGMASEWIDAMAALGTVESKGVLLGFVDQELKQLGIKTSFEEHDRRRLASKIVDIARPDPTVKTRLFQLCAGQHSPETRLLLASIIVQLGTAEAFIAGFNLIHDQDIQPIPFELECGLEGVILEQRPYGNTSNSFIRLPQSANEIRAILFNMVLNDENRRQSAWTLLGQIELWRLEHGRPSNEPRHPAFDSGKSWPTLTPDEAGVVAAAALTTTVVVV